MPRATLSAVVDELVAAFGSTLVRLEVPGAGGQPPALAEQLLRGAVSEALPRVAVQDVPARRVPSVDRAGYVWLSYELTADVPVNAGSPA